MSRSARAEWSAWMRNFSGSATVTVAEACVADTGVFPRWFVDQDGFGPQNHRDVRRLVRSARPGAEATAPDQRRETKPSCRRDHPGRTPARDREPAVIRLPPQSREETRSKRPTIMPCAIPPTLSLRAAVPMDHARCTEPPVLAYAVGGVAPSTRHITGRPATSVACQTSPAL